ncbi:thioesterase II family protein [Bordetella genomosp. 13]|uniref:thioesterase II family protein n=1 Tax=Bordetella genomosp. 13 TaxID=463040 RepID=UPI0011A48D8E|nr:thioesterase domain-containing protein [Bordetella genomosp. 13]
MREHDWFPHGAPAAALDGATWLYCFHHAGGSAASYAAWRQGRPDGTRVCAVQLPCRAGQPVQGVATSMARLVPPLADAFARHRAGADTPFVFYGHSLGALVAFELTRALRRRGLPQPALLVVSGRRAPACALRGRPLWDRPDEELLDALARMGGMAPGLLASPKWRDFVLPSLRADLRLSDMYPRPVEPPLALPIHAFRGHDDPILAPDEIAAWRRETTAAGHVATLPGAHFFEAAGTRALLAHIDAELTALAQGAASSPTLEMLA